MSEQCEKRVTSYLGLFQSCIRMGRKVGGRGDGKGKLQNIFGVVFFFCNFLTDLDKQDADKIFL